MLWNDLVQECKEAEEGIANELIIMMLNVLYGIPLIPYFEYNIPYFYDMIIEIIYDV